MSKAVSPSTSLLWPGAGGISSVQTDHANANEDAFSEGAPTILAHRQMK